MKALLARYIKKKRLGNFLSENNYQIAFLCLTVGFEENLSLFFSEKRNDLLLPSTETFIVFQPAQGVRPEMTGTEGAFRKSCRWLPYRSMLPVEVWCRKVQ